MKPVSKIVFTFFVTLLFFTAKAGITLKGNTDVVQKNECTKSEKQPIVNSSIELFNEGVLQPVIKINESAPVTFRFTSIAKFIANPFVNTNDVGEQLLSHANSTIAFKISPPIYLSLRVLLI